jgi:hypothetical protein
MRDDKPTAQIAATTREQSCYARLLWWGGWIGLAVLVVGFLIYAAGLLPPLIVVEELPRVWALSAQELRAQEGHPAGWTWLAMLGRGDIFNLIGIALLAGCSAVPLLAVAWLYWQRRERLYAALSGAQAAVLILAASGIVGVGH